MTMASGEVGLETPSLTAKPKGLVPRSAIWVVAGTLLLGLVVYAVFDVSRETGRRKVAATKAPEANLGNAPSPDTLARLEVEQVGRAAAKAAAASEALSSAPAPGGRVALALGSSPGTGPGPVPREVLSRAEVGVPDQVRDPSRSEGGPVDQKAVTAHHELQARISSSSLVAIDGKGGSEGALNPMGQPQRGRARSPDMPSIEELEQSLPKMPDTETILKAMATAKAAGDPRQAGMAERSSAWVKQMSETKAPPVTYASDAPGRNLLLQGTRIAAVTLEAINSDMPGQISARATEDLRDSLTQRTVLVPAGTRFMGSYNAEVAPGQSRVLMAFNRMVLPDGRSVDLHASNATDAIGQSGITGEVNNHFLKMYAYSLAVAIAGERLSNKGVTSGGTSQTGQQQSTKTIAGEVLADVSRRILDRNANIPPTITTPIGERIYITITRDIVLAPWKGHQQ